MNLIRSKILRKFFVHDLNLKKEKNESMKVKGIRTIGVSTLKNGNLNLDEIFKNLSKLGLTSVLVEGGENCDFFIRS